MLFKLMAIIAISLSFGLMVSSTSILLGNTQNQAYAEANCEKAGLDFNNGFNLRGNGKQCSNFGEDAEGPKEPIRDCNHKNSLKDNDGDGNHICLMRGN